MKKKLAAHVLLVFLVLCSMNCTGENPSNDSTQDTIVTETPLTPIQPPPRPNNLEKDLEMVQTEIQIEENTYRGLVGDATRAMLISTSPSASDEDKELAQERVNTSLDAANKSKAKLNKLREKESSIKAEINKLGTQ